MPVGIEECAELARALVMRDDAALQSAFAHLERDPESAAKALRTSHLVELLRRTVAATPGLAPSPGLLEAMARQRPVQRAEPETLLLAFDEVRTCLERSGIPVLLLKGVVFAERLYGGLDRRPQFDVDVLVRRRDARAARETMKGAGYERLAYDLHSQTFRDRNGIKIDLHHCLRTAPAYRLDEEAWWRDAEERLVSGRRIPTLSDDHTLLQLVLTGFEDLGQGMARMKQCLDVFLLARDLDERFDWAAFLARRERENVRDVAVNVLALALDVLRARDQVPRLGAELARHVGEIRHRDRAEALRLLGGPSKAPASFAWFAQIYPGSIALYLARFWLAGFPANLTEAARPSLWRSVGHAARLRTRPRP